MMKKRWLFLLAVLFVLGLIAAQCRAAPSNNDADANPAEAVGNANIIVTEPFVQASIPNGAVYFNLTNTGNTADVLVSVETNIAETSELHEGTIDGNDVVQMGLLDQVEIPAGGSVKLEPGGQHVMLTGLTTGLKQGDKVALTLNFQNSPSQTIEAEVRLIAGSTQGDQEAIAEADAAHDDEAADHEHEAQTASDQATEPGTAAERFQATIATYLLDTAGFHELDERLNDGGMIEAGDAGVVERATGALMTVAWPAGLSQPAADLAALLAEYAEALANNDVEAAKPLAAQAHEAQHDFAHAVEHWLADGQQASEAETTWAFDIVLATYLLDTAGFHELDERLNDEGVIEAGDAGVVERVQGVVAVVTWPDDLAEPAATLIGVLDQYAAALADDDLEAAKPLATQAHEAQHELSHEIQHWLDHADDQAVALADDHMQRFQATIATYLLDTAGFHELDERLNDQGVIEPGDAGIVERVRGLVAVVSWPDDLAEPATLLAGVLDQYAVALANDDVEAAKPLAAQAHEAQHELSHEVEHWLSGGHGEDDHHDDEGEGHSD